MNDRKQISPRSRRQRSCISLLDALHESRRCQAARVIDNYRHLLGAAEVDEIRRATKEFTRERVSMRRLCSIWRQRVRAPARPIAASQDQPDYIGRNASKGKTDMGTKLSFHKAPRQFGGKPQGIDRVAQCSTSGQMSFWTTVLVITILVGFAVLHVIGFTLMMTAPEQPTVAPAHMYPTD